MSSRDLTPRQREIVTRLQQPNATQSSVAEELGIHDQTLRNHLQVAYRTFGVSTFGGLLRKLRERTPVPH